MLARLLTSAGIEQVEHGKVLDIQDFIHAFEAQAAFAVEEVGDVGLLESGLLGQAKTSQFAFFNAFPEGFSQIFLQRLEFHARKYSTRL